MNAEEFLASEHAASRSKIGAFDADIRLLRSRGVSGQRIANFLKLNNVHVTASAVYQYFKYHPNGYRFSTRSPTNNDQRASAGQTSAHNGTPATDTAANVSAQQPSDPRSAKASSQTLHAREVGLTDASVGQRPELRASSPSSQLSEPRPVVGDQRPVGGRALANDTHLDGSANGSENTRAFDPSGTPDSNYDRGTREGPRLDSVEDEPRVRSKMIHWDPFSPENREAVLAYVEGLKAGTIPTGVITNSERQSNERQEDPDHP